MQYRSEIDGLRAIAVVPVILFHAGFSVFSGGYVGVDVFFVISGYLITRIIVGELNSQTFSLKRFYIRRARRILPALLFVILCCIPVAWVLMLPHQFKGFSQAVFATSLFASNILFSYKHRYFSETAIDEMPLIHTWSLGVEEQFYVFFPLLLLFLWRFGADKIFYGILIIAIISLSVSEWGWRQYPHANFYLATSRAWELLAGSVCALVELQGSEKRSELLSVLGAFLIGSAIFYFDETTPFPSVYTLVPVIGTCLIVLYAKEQTYVSRILSTRLLVGLGLISYSAYLWHQPLFAFARIRSLFPLEQWVMALLAAISIGFAYLSWRFIETPLRQKREPSPERRSIVLPSFALISIGFMAFGLFGHFTNGKEVLWSASVDSKRSKMYQLIADAKGPNLHLRQDNGACRFNVQALDANIKRRIFDCYETYGSGLAVLGGSHAIDLFGAITSVADSKFIVGVTRGYCRPHNPAPFCQYDGFLRFVSNSKNVFKTIIYEQTGRTLLLDDEGKEVAVSLFSKQPMGTLFPVVGVNDKNLSEVHEYLLELAMHTDVIWLGPRIEPHISENFMLKVGCDYQFTLPVEKVEPFLKLDQAISERVQAEGVKARLKYVSQIQMTKFDVSSDFTSCDVLYWSDGNHWSAHGENLFGHRLTGLGIF